MGGIKFVLLAPSMLVFCLFDGELFRLRLPFDMSHVFQAGALFVSGHLSCLAAWRRSITKLRLIDDRLSLSPAMHPGAIAESVWRGSLV